MQTSSLQQNGFQKWMKFLFLGNFIKTVDSKQKKKGVGDFKSLRIFSELNYESKN